MDATAHEASCPVLENRSWALCHTFLETYIYIYIYVYVYRSYIELYRENGKGNGNSYIIIGNNRVIMFGIGFRVLRILPTHLQSRSDATC